VIRPARPGDVPAIYQLIRDLAAYERSLPAVTGTQQDLASALFGPEPAVFAHVVDRDGRVAGFALWYVSYSTWQGRHGIYLEDVYVEPDQRGRGY
jgi:GNAT superfamily N-acetyltransferase